jgi:hypothetical protein
MNFIFKRVRFLTKKNSENARKLFLQELSVVSMTDMELVEMKGVEPSTSRMRTERSPTELHPHVWFLFTALFLVGDIGFEPTTSTM